MCGTCIEGTSGPMQNGQGSAIRAVEQTNAGQNMQQNQDRIKLQNSVQITNPDLGNRINLLV
ncbi:MAG: hypothetical protein LBH07_08425 [Treponema sp.]|nr:hypothetical protein [Treponema sp.]